METGRRLDRKLVKIPKKDLGSRFLRLLGIHRTEEVWALVYVYPNEPAYENADYEEILFYGSPIKIEDELP